MDSGVNVKKILVRAPNWIGDAVMCLPALSSLKALFPASRITVLAKGRVVPVFENNPDMDDIMEYDDSGRHGGLRGRFRLSGEIKERDFQLAVLFQNAFDAAFIAFISRIPERVGYARDLRTRLLTIPVRPTPEIKKVHQSFYYLNIIKEIGGIYPASPVPEIYISREEALWAKGFLKENGLENALLVGCAPGASYGPSKRWMPENFAEVLLGLSKSRNASPIIFGGPEDSEACKKVSERIKGKHLNLAGRCTLRQSMALVRNLGVFISNDSGPVHLSAALGVPTVALFGSTDANLTGPLGRSVRVVTKNVECSPCFERTCRYRHYKCLSLIRPDEVLREAESLMA